MKRIISANFLVLFFVLISSCSRKTEISVVFPGDYADPSVLRVGNDFYITHTSYDYYPGLEIWHSTDLKHWKPLCRALRTNVGEVWAPDFVFYHDKYYIYFPTNRGKNFVITADKPEGPWSEPAELKISGIDPGHIATPEGKRYLYVNDGSYSPLAENGLAVTDSAKHVYDGWQYPQDWMVECFCLESPKLTYKDGFYYLTSAQGGTSGPTTGHMAVVARSESPEGPWTNNPDNPLIHTFSTKEAWASKGHATLFSDASGDWWAVYHACRKDNRSEGRNTLIERVYWNREGWPYVSGNKAKSNAYKTYNNIITENDDFSGNSLKLQWFFSGVDTLGKRYEIKNGELALQSDSLRIRALLCQPSQQNYEVVVKLRTEGNVETGLVAFYNEKCFTGIRLAGNKVTAWLKGRRAWSEHDAPGCTYLKIKMVDNNIQMFYSSDNVTWTPYTESFETSGYQTNMLGGFANLKIAVCCKGKGKLFVDDFNYKPLD